MKNNNNNEHHEDVEACLATPHGVAQGQDDLEKMTHAELVVRVRTLEGMLKQRVKEVGRLYQEGRSPRGVIEMLEQELRAEREKVVSLQRQLWDERIKVRKLEEEIAEQWKKVPTFNVPMAGMTFPFTIDTAHRDIVEITVNRVDITDGKHRVHMTAAIRLPEAQPQEVPPPVVEPAAPTFVEVRDVPGVVTQLSLQIDVAPPATSNTPGGKEMLKHIDVKTTNPDAPPFVDFHTYTASRMFGVPFKEVTADIRSLLAYEQAGTAAVADREDEYIAARMKEAAESHTVAPTENTENMEQANKEDAMVVSRTEPTVVNGWEVLEEEGARRVRDIDIAERAGLAKPRNIRATIKANKDALEKFGPLQVRPQCGRTRMPQERGVREDRVNEYWLNERQAIRLVQYLRTPASKEMNENVFTSLMDLFDSFRKGELVPASPFVVPTNFLEALQLSANLEKARLLLERDNAAKDVALKALATSKGRVEAEGDGMAVAITNLETAMVVTNHAMSEAKQAVTSFKELTDTKNLHSVDSVAKSMGYNEEDFFELMRADGLIMSGRRDSNGMYTIPYKECIDDGLFFLRQNKSFRKPGKKTDSFSYTTFITGKGSAVLQAMYKEGGTHRRDPDPSVGIPRTPRNPPASPTNAPVPKAEHPRPVPTLPHPKDKEKKGGKRR